MERTLAILALLIPTVATASNPCSHFFVKHQAVAVVAPVYAAPIYYQAGRDIEAEAIAAKVAKLVIGQLRAELRAPQQQVTQSQSAIAQHCAKCHSGATPKASLTYDGLTPVPPELVVAALRAIKDEAMPKDHKIDAAVKGALMEELLSLDSTPVQQPNRQQPEQIPPAFAPADRPPPAPPTRPGDLQ